MNWYLNINVAEQIEARIRLFDSRGGLLKEGNKFLNMGTNSIRWDVRNFVPGTYFAKIQVGNDLWYRKILVQ